MSFKKISLGLMALALLSSCNEEEKKTSSSTAEITSAIKEISTGIEAAGEGLETSAKRNRRFDFTNITEPLVAALCNEHGMPMYPASENGGAQMPENDFRYPFIHTYCAMTVNDGETVLGGFSLATGLICSLEKGSIRFAGNAQTININFNDTECWPNGGPDEDLSSVTISATGSSPASFNSHFDKGVVFTVSEFGLTFKIAANITGTSTEFIAHEEWSDGDKSVMAGSLDSQSGELRFEKRDERIRANCSNQDCGWNRHTRLAAQLDMVNGEPQGLTSLSYGYADTHVPDIADSSSTTASGKIITAAGTLASGIKARIFSTAGNRTLTQMRTPSEWIEDTNTGCMNETGVVATNSCKGIDCYQFIEALTCGETGVDLFTSNTKFALFSSPAHMSSADWLEAYNGFDFDSVDLDVDLPFVSTN